MAKRERQGKANIDEATEHQGRLTERGVIDYVEFIDTYGCTVTLRQSSAAEYHRCWIFVHGPDGKDGKVHLGEWQAYSPHLGLREAILLRDALNRFIEDEDTRLLDVRAKELYRRKRRGK